ncbi:hypothetical protein TNIN_499121 [Trichonephila inaurata madagascariensis]|uniref:Uncharacterized protein n=1 Tax=Trichonephila inaurata madagascariensis TaxID=2747483 RepID=A0A8X7BQS6_9ARAC|nr:hypothetical protein TNIN_499121 [Trichonephila inaurata madagascariensis]
MSANRMHATSDDNVSSRVNRMATIIHGMVAEAAEKSSRAQNSDHSSRVNPKYERRAAHATHRAASSLRLKPPALRSPASPRTRKPFETEGRHLSEHRHIKCRSRTVNETL